MSLSCISEYARLTFVILESLPPIYGEFEVVKVLMTLLKAGVPCSILRMDSKRLFWFLLLLLLVFAYGSSVWDDIKTLLFPPLDGARMLDVWLF